MFKLSKMKIVVNIGLKVGDSEPKEQLVKTLRQLTNFELTNVRVEDEGIYKGNGERTVVAYFDILYYNNLFESLCFVLHQEAIAYKINGEGKIAFNPLYEGEEFPFDQQFFID